MLKLSEYLFLLVLGILGACICGGRTSECNGNAKISLLTTVHDDSTCSNPSSRGVIMSEAAKMFVDAHNAKNNNLKIDLSVLDTCGTVTGSTTAAMKALSSSCLHPPYFLGLIGPESPQNIDAVQKITSILHVPHIVNTNSMSSPYLHNLHEETDSYVVQGILEILEVLKWKSFTLTTPKYNSNSNKDDDIQVIAKKVTNGAISRGLCVMIHDEDDSDDFSSRIVYIGKPPKSFFKNLAATVVIASEGNLRSYIDKIDYSHSIVLLEDTRTDLAGIESKVENSKLWSNKEVERFDTEEMREIRWLKDALEVYTKSYELLCKKKKCSSEVNHAEWNTLIGNVISTKNAQLQIATRTIDIYLRVKNGVLDKLGEIKVKKNDAIVDWDDENSNNNGDDDDDDLMPDSFRGLLSSGNDKSNDCATSSKNFKTRNNPKIINNNNNNNHNRKKYNNDEDDDDDDDDDEISRVLYAENDEYEFWTVVAVVSGIGVSMFTIGILAVYVVFNNIRGPRSPKHKGGRRYSTNGSVIRRVNSERELQIVTQTPIHQPSRPNQRRNSNHSLGSVISDKSV